jgi:hypothetical protein
MNVEIGAEAAQFPEKEYINGITELPLQCTSSLYKYVLFMSKQNIVQMTLNCDYSLPYSYNIFIIYRRYKIT